MECLEIDCGRLETIKSGEKGEKETAQAMAKIEKQKRLSSEEFLKLYDALWKEGPSVKYQSPDAWNRHQRKPTTLYNPFPNSKKARLVYLGNQVLKMQH